MNALLLASLAALAGASDVPKSGPLDVEALLAAHPRSFRDVLERHEELRLQLAVAVIVEREDGSLALERGTLGDLGVYFYPASSIKTAAAVAALELVNEINVEHGTAFGLDTELVFEPLFEGEERETLDPSHLAGGRITLGHEIRKLSIVSDNAAFNRLYELVGQDRIAASMTRAGFPSFHVVHRLSEGRSAEENRRSPAITLRAPGGSVALELEARTCEALPEPPELPGLLTGETHVDGETTIEEPFDFHGKNRVDLLELQDFLVELVRPDVDTGRRGFPGLSTEQRAFLLRAMRELPRESDDPAYDAKEFPDDWVKFLLPGLRRVLPAERIAVYDKIGLAYGFTVENAYVEDRATGRGFFVAGALYTNPNGVVNDGEYAYDEVALPFWADLGEVLAEHLLGERR